MGALVSCRITHRYKYQIYRHMQQQAHWYALRVLNG